MMRTLIRRVYDKELRMTHHSLLCALIIVGGLLITTVTRSDATERPEQLKAACEKGKAAACESRGDLYLNGTGVKQDDSQAAALYRRACDKGALGGCFALGWTIGLGEGSSKTTGKL